MDSLSSSDVHTIGVRSNNLFHSTGGTVDDTPIFLLDPNVHCLSLICANYKIRFNFIKLITLEVIVAQIDDLSKELGRLVVSLTPPSYPTAALPVPSQYAPSVEAFLDVLYLNNNSEPTFRLKEASQDFYFELTSGYAITVSYLTNSVLIVSAMAPYNAETELTELATQLILDL